MDFQGSKQTNVLSMKPTLHALEPQPASLRDEGSTGLESGGPQ